MKTTVIGSYPKISENGGVNLRSAITQWEQKKINDAQLKEAYEKTVQRVIREQEEAGLDIITDGQIARDDLLRPFAARLGGCAVGGMTRFFNNNFYYRQPIVQGEIRHERPLTVEEFDLAKRFAKKPLKVALPGPLTLTNLCEDTVYKDFKKLLFKFAEAINAEGRLLEKAGVTTIQIDEPSLAFQKDNLDSVFQAIDQAVQGWRVKKVLTVYFGSVKPVMDRLARSSVDVVGLDLIEAPKDLEAIGKNFPKEVALGCIDARNTKLEDPRELRKLFEAAAKQVAPEKLYVNPNCGLEFLPHETAQKKMAILVEAVRQFQKGGR